MVHESSRAQRVYRVDRFAVPAAAREEFLERVRQTHEVLKAQTGFLQDLVLEQPTGDDAVSVVTIAEWENMAAVERARSVVQARHREIGFDPQETIARLEIKAEIGNYREVRRR